MPNDETTTKWDGYSDYQTVSQRITRSIHDAIEAAATIERAHKENARVDSGEAARAGSSIMFAAINVQTELQAYEDENEQYEQLLAKFEGDDGYVHRFRQAQLHTECPDWLYEFVVDIRTAGFELGYLKAGREQEEQTGNTPEGQAKEMFANL